MRTNVRVQLSKRQQEICDLLKSAKHPPTARELCQTIGISLGTISRHLEALRKKGILSSSGKARSFRINYPDGHEIGTPLLRIPLYGSIPAGFADERHQEAEGYVTVDAGTLGMKPTARTYALRVRGDSMIERHILPGDVAILEHGREARAGDVVAALIDGESTLKVLLQRRGKAFLRAANPQYPDLIPASELSIQGVLVGLVRQCRP